MVVVLELILLASSPVLCAPSLAEAMKLLEELSAEGVNVSGQVKALNQALDLYRSNRTAEADALVTNVLQQLYNLEAQLPSYRLQKWLYIGLTLAVLLSIPPLFYYYFPRLYALAWAYSRKDWLLKEVKKRDHRR
ncbi:MAG: hypothetical protein ABWK01_03880 [Infirmifilum sp.]